MKDQSYHDMVRDIEKVPPELRDLVLFYGKLCPGLLMTSRLTMAAMARLGVERHDRDLQAIVESGRCHSAGVQWFTGCVGSKRLIVKEWGRASFTLFNRHTGRALRAYVKTGFPPAEITNGLTRHQLFFRLLEVPVEEYARFEEVRITEPLPDPGPPKGSGYCRNCGERVIDGALEMRDGKEVCLACSSPYFERIENRG